MFVKRALFKQLPKHEIQQMERVVEKELGYDVSSRLLIKCIVRLCKKGDVNSFLMKSNFGIFLTIFF